MTQEAGPAMPEREAIIRAVSPIIVRNTPSVGRTCPEITSDIAAAIISLTGDVREAAPEREVDWSFLPKQIGRLELGERPSGNERYCNEGHVTPDGAPLYWPMGMGEYDDRDPYCLEHAIQLAESDSSWCPTCIAKDLASPPSAHDMREALEKIARGSERGLADFKDQMTGRKAPNWRLVNILQDNLAACRGTASAALASSPMDAVKAAVEAEREACARLADDTFLPPDQGLHARYVEAANHRAFYIAQAIRARAGGAK